MREYFNGSAVVFTTPVPGIPAIITSLHPGVFNAYGYKSEKLGDLVNLVYKETERLRKSEG